MDPDGVDSSSARKRQKVGELAGSHSSKKAWRNDSGRDYHQDGYQEQSYGDYARKGYGNEQYNSGQKYPQREGGDRYYSRENYASNPEGDANSWKARSASPWYDEYNTAAYGASSSWNNSSSGGGRYRGDYPADPYYAGAEGTFGRANTRQDGYGYHSGAYRGNSTNLERTDGPPSSSTSAYYRADGYASSRYNYDYSNAYHDRFDERGYGPDTTTPVVNRYGTAARGAGRYGFGNAFRTGNVSTGANGKYATNFKTRQYSFGAKKAPFVKNNTRNNANKNASNSGEEAQAEEKEPEKPKVITDQLVKDFLTLRTNLLDFHLTMALLKLSLKPDLELRQTLIANTIAAPLPVAAPVAVAVTAPVEATMKDSVVDAVPALIRTTSGVDARASSNSKCTPHPQHQQHQHQQMVGPNAPLMRAASYNPAGHGGDVATPQMKRAVSAQFGRNVDNAYSQSQSLSNYPQNNTTGRDDAARPDLVRRDSTQKETQNRFPTQNRFDTPEVPSRYSRDAEGASFPVSSVTVPIASTPRADAGRDERVSRERRDSSRGRELSRERSSARSVSRPRNYDEGAVSAASRAAAAPPLYRDSSAGGLPRGNPARGSSRERAVGGVAGYRTNPAATSGAQSQGQGQGYERGRSREPQHDAYGYPPHQQQQQGYYHYPAGGYGDNAQQYGGYDDRYGYADGYGYDDRGYGYPRGGGGGAGYGAGYEQPSGARRDHSRERPPAGGAYGSAYAGRYDTAPASGGRDASASKTRPGGYPDQRGGGGGTEGGFARQLSDTAGGAPGRRGRSPSRSQGPGDRRQPQQAPSNKTIPDPPSNSLNTKVSVSSDAPASAAKQALAKLETHLQQMPPPESGKRSRSPSVSVTPAPLPFQSIHPSSESLHSASRSKNQSPEPGQVEEDALSPPQQQQQQQQQVQYQGGNVNKDDGGGFRGPQHQKGFHKNFSGNQQQHQQQGQVRHTKTFHQNQPGQGQGQGQQGAYQHQHQQGNFQQPHQAANFNGNNKFHKNQHKFQQKGGALGSTQQHQHQQGYQQGQPQRQQQGQQGHQQGHQPFANPAGNAAVAANMKSPVKKLAPGEAPPLRTPR